MAAKVTPELVRAIRKGAERGDSPREIAMLYGLATETIRRIIRRETWAHLADVEDIVAAAMARTPDRPITAEEAKRAMESQDKMLKLLAQAGQVDLPEPAAVLDPFVVNYLKGNSEERGDIEGDATL